MMIIYKNTHLLEMKDINPPRHGFIIILEVLSLFPLEFSLKATDHEYDRKMVSMRLRYLIRMVRVWMHARHCSKRYNVIGVFEMITNMMIGYCLVAITATIIVVPALSISHRKYVTGRGFLSFVYAVNSKITAKGFGMAFGETRLFDYCFCLLVIIAFFMASYYTSKVACSMIPWIKHKFSFAHDYSRMRGYIQLWHASTHKFNLYRCVCNFY